MKTVRIPLRDTSGRDFMTGEQLPPRPVEKFEKRYEKAKDWLKQKKSYANNEGKIYVSGFGRVAL